MNKIIGFLGTYLCYYLGSIFGFLAYEIEWEWLYVWYSNLMGWSTNIQDWAGLKGPWKKPSITLEEHDKIIKELRQKIEALKIGNKQDAIDFALYCKKNEFLNPSVIYDTWFEIQTAIRNGSI